MEMRGMLRQLLALFQMLQTPILFSRFTTYLSGD